MTPASTFTHVIKSIKAQHIIAAIALFTTVFIAQFAMAQTYQVTVTNLTRGQVLSPPAVLAHNGEYSLFRAGEEPGSALTPLAEDGDTQPLLASVSGDLNVVKAVAGENVIPPGQSDVIFIKSKRRFKRLSLASMLVTTNDGFAGLSSRPLPTSRQKSLTYYAMAYDAGTEGNSESCEHIPGPPCGNGGSRYEDGVEGFISVHAGIHGVGDLTTAELDWRGPVLRVEVTRMAN